MIGFMFTYLESWDHNPFSDFGKKNLQIHIWINNK